MIDDHSIRWWRLNESATNVRLRDNKIDATVYEWLKRHVKYYRTFPDAFESITVFVFRNPEDATLFALKFG